LLSKYTSVLRNSGVDVRGIWYRGIGYKAKNKKTTTRNISL